MNTSLYDYYPSRRRLTSNFVYAMRDKIRDWKALRMQSSLQHRRPEPWSDQGFRIIGKTQGVSGLSRAFRYEIDRLRAADQINQTSRNVIILGQPRGYRRTLRTVPDWFYDTYRIGLWVTEFETFPPDWKFALDIVNEIWTPSEFSARAIRSATTKPVTVVPHAVHVPDGEAMQRNRFGISEHAFLGMAIMDLGTCPDRKNPLAVISAWKQAFGKNADCQLLIKTRFSPKTRFARIAILEAISGFNNIRLVEENFSDEDMTAFQRMADVYISLHRSEGYGLNIHEMLELGKPVIATGWSANMDYMPRYQNAYPVPYTLVPYSDPTRHYRGDDLKWAEADIDSAAKILRNNFLVHKPASQRNTSVKLHPFEIFSDEVP